MIEIVEMKIENDFVTIFDDKNLINIEMEKKYVEEIMNFFNTWVQGKLFMSEEFYIGDKILKLNLINFGEIFDINGRIYGNLNDKYFNGFELESCDIKTWDKIFLFIKNN